MEVGTAELLGGYAFAGGGLHEGRATKENCATFLDHDDLVGHGWYIGAASCAGTHDNSDLGDALGRHASLVVENVTEVVLVGEDILLLGKESTT